jgi:hypothetical protein
MTCPKCHERISVASLWTGAGLSHVVCAKCAVALKPKPISAILVFVLSFGLAEVAMLILRRVGSVYWMTFVGFFVVFALVFAVSAPLLLRFQVKEPRENPVAIH